MIRHISLHRARTTGVLVASLAVLSITACGPRDQQSAPPTSGAADGAPPAAVSAPAAAAPAPEAEPTLLTKSAAPRTDRPGGTETRPRRVRDGGGRCPAHPTPDCTGVPAGTKLTRLALNVDGAAYRVTKPGTVLNRVHIPGDLLITANDVTITESRIDGGVQDEYAGRHYSFTISDSTVGPADRCLTVPGIGEANYTAARVHVRGHGDGFRASGNDIAIRDSYVHLCSKPGDHSDGIQTYQTGGGLLLDHNTIDQRDARDVTAPVFITDPGASDVTVTNNLIMGGTYSLQVRNVSGTRVVKDNKVVNRSWIYGPVESDCSGVTWWGNTLVTIDTGYRITSTVGPLRCRS